MTLVQRELPVSVPKACCHKDGSNDADVLRLWALMAGGLGQIEASRIVWGDAVDLPGTPADAPGWVRRSLTSRLPWLREDGAACWWLLLAPAALVILGYLSAVAR